MRQMKWAVCALTVALASSAVSAQQKFPARTVLYEGARLIIGDSSAPIENGAFLVRNGTIVAIGATGSVAAPAGATKVDLTGKTVMPAFVNAHIHIGYEKYLTQAGKSVAENFTADNILDHLQREAFYGTGTVHDGGSVELDIAQQFVLDQQQARAKPAAAQLSVMGGVVPVNGGPDHILIQATRPLKANYEVIRSGEARAAVQLLGARGVKHIKVWIGDRNGAYPAMPRELYEAVIDEAHKVGIKVHAHATNLRDTKDAVRAGVDVVVHTIQNAKIDDELAALLREKKPYWTPVMGLGDRTEMCDGDPFIEQSMSASVLADIKANRCNPNPNAATREENLKYNFAKMIDSGARLVLGTDTGVFPHYSFGFAEHHEIGRYVQFGQTPAQAIMAATSRPAELLGLIDVGTLAVGKKADFVVLDANPLENIANTRKISAVYLRGDKFDREAALPKFKGGR